MCEDIGVAPDPERRGDGGGRGIDGTRVVFEFMLLIICQRGKYEAIDAVGANVASSGGDGGRRRYSYDRYNMIRLMINSLQKKGITLYSTTKPGVHIIS